MKAFITGGCGFVGVRLCNLLVKEGWDVTVFDMHSPTHEIKGVKFIASDIRSKSDIKESLASSMPDVVYHLAGIAFVPAAENDKETAFAVNVMGGMNLLDAVREKAPKAKVVVISSSEVYGKISNEKIPLTEITPVRPANFYAFTKAALENYSFYARAANLDIVVLRPFNHIGPKQSSLFVTSTFARQIAQIEKEIIPPVIKVGNLEAVRDFTDVEDIVRAYLVAGRTKFEHCVYNLSSGKGVRIQEILDVFLDLAKVDIKVEVDPSRLRPSDIPVLIGDRSRFTRETGWSPHVDLRKSLELILNHWRTCV